MREQAVINGVILGTIRRIMCYADGYSNAVGQFLQLLLEGVVVTVITASGVAKDQQAMSFWILGLSSMQPPIPQGSRRQIQVYRPLVTNGCVLY